MAYNAATITKNEPLPEGRFRVWASFTGNAGEPPIERDLYVDSSTTATSFRQWATAQRDALNASRIIGQLAALQIGQSINLAAIPPPTPTARDNFATDLQLLQRMDRAIKLNIKTTADADYIAQVASIKTSLTANPGWIDAF